MVAVRTFAVTALLLLLGCSSGDISVKSDVGEEYLVKEGSVKTLTFDADMYDRKYLRFEEKNVAMIEKLYSKCLNGLSVGECEDLVGSQSLRTGLWDDLDNIKQAVETLKTLPPASLIRFRTIDTDVNGDKTASNYWSVVCVPDGTQEEREDWGSVFHQILEDDGKDYKNNIADDGLVVSLVRRKVCEKYGQSS